MIRRARRPRHRRQGRRQPAHGGAGRDRLGGRGHRAGRGDRDRDERRARRRPARTASGSRRAPRRRRSPARGGSARWSSPRSTRRGKASPPVVVSPDVTAQIDVTLAEVGGKYVLAWTDERNIDAAVFVATVDPGGKIAVPPHRATPPFGEQALVSLVAESYAPGAPRSKRGAARLGGPAQGAARRAAHPPVDDRARRAARPRAGDPHVQRERAAGHRARRRGLRRAHPRARARHARRASTCTRPTARSRRRPVWPSFVRFGADLTVVASEPVRSDAFGAGDKVPYITRALTCRSGKCMTLGIGTSAGTRDANSPPAPRPSRSCRCPSARARGRPPRTARPTRRPRGPRAWRRSSTAITCRRSPRRTCPAAARSRRG